MRLIIGIIILSMIIIIQPVYGQETGRVKQWAIDSRNDKITYKVVDIDKSQRRPQTFLDLIFKNNRKIKPKVVLIKNDVAYISIEGDSSLITDRSGSTGALYFAATVVFNLTEFSNIKSVYFVDEGEHFSPGLFQRIDYWALMPTEEKRKYKEYIEVHKLNTKLPDVATYVEYLKEIGDMQTVEELKRLKKQMKTDFEPCSITKKEFEALLDQTINVIVNNLT